MRDTVPDPVLHSLCLQQMAPWLGAPIDRAAAEQIYHRLNETVRSIFLFRIAGGRVALLEKPGFTLRPTLHDSAAPEPVDHCIFREEFVRAQMYRQFFEQLLNSSGIAPEMLIAVDVNDAPIANAEAPVLAFQKPRGGNTVLIPDVDFLHGNFYTAPDVYDLLPYAKKLSRAIFAGSTTGGRTITAADVRDLGIERLRAGVYFKGSDQVDFRLPRIVQCESAAVAAMVAELEIDDRHCPWPEQFGHRFILSMDGNGATCSRVVIGLLSQAALVKYESPNLLYYFGALVPWRHYIPVANDAEVTSIVNAERRHDGLFENVAVAGAAFARRYLGRQGVCGYTALLLHLFESCMADAAPGRRRPVAKTEATAPMVKLGAHIAGVGDVWGSPGERIGEPGSGRPVEAIALIPSGIAASALHCRVMFADGSFSKPAASGYFHGTRGEDKKLHGFELGLSGDAARLLRCSYTGYFVDGSICGPLTTGGICQARSGAALEAFEITLRPVGIREPAILPPPPPAAIARRQRQAAS